MEILKDLPVLTFKTQEHWQDWLEENHLKSQGIWLKLAKKSSGNTSVTYAEAVEEALCYGWIDGQKATYDDAYWLQKFTPRSPKSTWSKINVVKAEALIKAKKMKPAGLATIEVGKKNKTWQNAYDSPSSATIPEDFQAALNKNHKAKLFFETLNKANVYGFCWRIQTAKKPETRQARIEKFIDMLNRGEKLH